jgi:multidrug efflux system membrane fusion protein
LREAGEPAEPDKVMKAPVPCLAPVACLAICVSVLTVVLAGCSSAKGEGSTPPPSAASTAVPVLVAPVEQKAMPIRITAVGAAEAVATVAVRSQATGELTSVHFADGDEVEKGQLLFTLDRRAFEAAVNQAEATLQRDIAQAANARSQQERYRDLSARGIATREQVDQMSSAAAALDATVAADRAALESARVQLSYSRITAPLSGRTGKLMVHVGNLVRATDAPPLVVINQISPIHVSFAIPETDLPEFKRYMTARTLRVEARAPNDDGPPSVGTVSFVDNSVDQPTGTIMVRGTFKNEDRRLWPGQYANVTVTLGSDANAIVIPSAAVQTGQQGPFVFVMKDDKTVDMRSVKVARSAGSDTIVASGVTPGETVVRDGHLRLVPGAHVSIRTEGSAEKTP